jgi:hypothetical protein
VPGISVSTHFGHSVSSLSDQDGRYRLDGLDKTPTRWMIASATGGDQPYYNSERKLDDSAGFEPMTVDIPMVKGVVVTGRLIDKANGRAVQAWVGYAALRDNPHWSRVPGFQSSLGNSYRPTRYVPAMADGSFPPGRPSWERLSGGVYSISV